MRLILIHGLGQTASSWDKTVPLLSCGSDTALVQLSDFVSEECTYDKMYRGFSDYCGSFSEPLYLCGLSLGAVLALNYAAEHPQNVRALALIAPQYKMPRTLLKFQSAIFRIMPRSAFSGGLTKNDFIRLTSSMAKLDFTDALKTVTCPVVIACGEKDKTNLSAARELTGILPDAEFITISNSGHEANIDNPKETARIINELVKH